MSITRTSRDGVRQPSCSRKTRRGGSRRISPSCWELLRETSRRSPILALTGRPYLHTYIRKPRRPTRSGCNDRRDVPTILGQSSRHRTADTHSRILYSLTFPPLPSFLNSEWLQIYDGLRGGGPELISLSSGGPGDYRLCQKTFALSQTKFGRATSRRVLSGLDSI